MELGSRVAVQQQPVEPDIVSERYTRHASSEESSRVGALVPAEWPQSVPVDQRLRVVRDSGEEISLRSVQVLESRYEEKDFAAPLREIPAEALVKGSVWSVFIAFDAPAP